MEEARQLIQQFTGLDASLYGIAVVIAVLIRFFRAYWYGYGNRATLLSAIVFGGFGSAIGVSGDHVHDWRFIIIQALSLAAAVLIAEQVLRKVPGLPHDDQVARAMTVAATIEAPHEHEAVVLAAREAAEPKEGK